MSLPRDHVTPKPKKKRQGLDIQSACGVVCKVHEQTEGMVMYSKTQHRIVHVQRAETLLLQPTQQPRFQVLPEALGTDHGLASCFGSLHGRTGAMQLQHLARHRPAS